MSMGFCKKNMFFFLSTMSDFKKKAKQLGMPLNLPVKPDPIKQNIFTAKIAEDQPYIFDICHMGQEMTNRGFGLEFAHKLSAKIWSVKNWNMDEHLIEILSEFNIELSEIREAVKKNKSRLIDQIKQNQVEQLEAGHHGVPLSVYKDEYFFGQDKFDDLLDRMKLNGDI